MCNFIHGVIRITCMSEDDFWLKNYILTFLDLYLFKNRPQNTYKDSLQHIQNGKQVCFPGL